MSVKNKILSCCAAFVVCCGVSYESLGNKDLTASPYFRPSLCVAMSGLLHLIGVPVGFVLASLIFPAVPLYINCFGDKKHNIREDNIVIVNNISFWLGVAFFVFIAYLQLSGGIRIS